MTTQTTRKTVKVGWLKETINLTILRAETEMERLALAFILEKTLMETGNYKGFAYVRKDGTRQSVENVHSGHYDQSLRHYF